MSDVKRIHHINFLYRDLDAAVARFELTLGVGPFEYEDLASRGARTARTKVGDTWIVLVSPTRADSVPGRHLDEYGEGFFLISFGVDDLDEAIEAFGRRTDRATGPIRQGINGWRIADLPAGETAALHLQLTEDPG